MSTQNQNKKKSTNLLTSNSRLNFLRQYRKECGNHNMTPVQFIQSAKLAWQQLTPEGRLIFDEEQYVQLFANERQAAGDGKSMTNVGVGGGGDHFHMQDAETMQEDIREQSTSKGVVSKEDDDEETYE